MKNAKDKANPLRRWRRGELAELWGVNTRTIDRMWRDGRIGKPKFIGKFPIWTDEQRQAAERDVSEAA